jgi:hypothetical protein
MPAEFAMAAYRFGHSMIRNGYILNSSLPALFLGRVLQHGPSRRSELQ